MAVAKEKVWTHTKETYAGSAVLLTQFRTMMLKIVNYIIAAGGVVTSSCNATDFGNNDDVNWWATIADLNWNIAANAKSWIVIRLFDRYLLICLVNNSVANAYYANIVFSDVRFYGGSTTAIPAPASSRSAALVSTPAITWLCNVTGANQQFQLHVSTRTNGIRIFISNAGSTGMLFLWENLEDAQGVPQPVLGIWKGDQASGMTPAYFAAVTTNAATSVAITELALEPAGGWSDTQVKLAARDVQADNYYNGWLLEIVGGTQDGQQVTVTDYDSATNELTVGAMAGDLDATSEYMLCPRIRSTVPGRAYLTVPLIGASYITGISLPNDWSGPAITSATWPWWPIRVWSSSSEVGQRGDRGRIPDLFWSSGTLPTGQVFDTDLTADWVQYGHLVTPNDGTACPVT